MENLQENIRYKDIHFGPSASFLVDKDNGIKHYKNQSNIDEHPSRITDKLIYWAEQKPDDSFLCRRDVQGQWASLSYKEALDKTKAVAQYFIDLQFSETDSIVILSENSIEHALISLGAMHIGIPFAPISPAYSLVSTDFGKLKHCLELMSPKVVFAQSGTQYKSALDLCKTLFPSIVIVTCDIHNDLSFDSLLDSISTEEVDTLHEKVNADTIAKILFTSGSTGLPKGVMNHHGMLCASLQQITQVLPFMHDTPPVFIDWLPWNHTFGGNQNFGMTLYNGGTLYLDGGKPSPAGMEQTIENLRDISPTAYFNVPKGFEMLVPYLENEKELREKFFAKLNIIFYAGASLAQPVWNKLEKLSEETIGKRIPIITGLGCTEAGPSAMFANWPGAFSGLLGVPVPGLDVKLAPDGDKVEARYKGPNVTKGYWRNTAATLDAFDEEGYYKTGDAVKFLDPTDPDRGLVFDGRIAEDFKLSSGTWVNVGIMKAKAISTGSPIIQDVVIAGLDKAYIGVIIFLNLDACQKLTGENQLSNEKMSTHKLILEYLDNWLIDFNKTSTGSSTAIRKYIIANEPPSIDLGEVTDKGSLNQRAILKHRVHLVNQLFE